MTYNSLKFEVADQVATITFCRPEAANSLSLEMSEELHAVATHCASNPDIRAAILTGEGKMFCAGGDVIGRRRTRMGYADSKASTGVFSELVMWV